MHFIWSQALWALLSLPLLIILYIWILRRRRSYAVQFSSLQIVRGAVSWRTRYRRHIPPALILMAITVGIIGLARPTATVTLPADYMTLVMAVDVSRSMLAEDVEPNRIKAAQAAVKEFIRELPVDIRVGIVSFAGTAQVVQAVSESRTDLVEAIDRFQLQRGTATGSGLLLAHNTLIDSLKPNEEVLYQVQFGPMNLAQGLFSITVAFGENDISNRQNIFRIQSAIYFQVTNAHHGWAPFQFQPKWQII
jgi:Ca-activated chloride channel family protein